MRKPKIVYIGLGSNLGERFKNLQGGLDAIFRNVGSLISISSVYETAADGFEGPSFLNACCIVSTYLSPIDVLGKLKAIEKKMGREVKTNISGYSSRIIDLDILFYEKIILKTEELQIPHPRLHERNFVLKPLAEIAALKLHPASGKTVEELCSSWPSSQIKKIELQLVNLGDKYKFTALNYLAIEGNIGSGKTSLAHMISSDCNAKLILERFADNPFLPKFYQDPGRYAFTLEMSFMADRYQQISEDLGQLSLFKDFIVSDYYVYKSLIFSKITLSSEEYLLYRKLFYQIYKDLPRPDLYVYLYQTTEQLQTNIKKRGREYEQEITKEYLDNIQTGYADFLKEQNELNVLLIDISERDFVNNREDYLWTLNQINSHINNMG